MRSLIFAFLLIASLDGLAQIPDAESNPYGWGPGEIGDSVDVEELPIRLESRNYRIAGNSLYKMNYRTGCCFKLNDLTFDVRAIYYGYTENYLTLWTSDEEYRYDVETSFIERFPAYGLLSPFLSRIVTNISAMRGYYGCFEASEENVTHTITESDEALPSLKYEHTPAEENHSKGYQINGVGADELTRILRVVNLEPHRVSALAEFDIQDEDLVEYASWVKEHPEWLGNDGLYWDADTSQAWRARVEEFYLGLINRFDTVGPDLVRDAILRQYDMGMSTSTQMYRVELVNGVDDTLRFSFTSNGYSTPYNLPWTIEYNGSSFMTFDADLARVLVKMLPKEEFEDESLNVEAFHKKMLLIAIANYLFAQQEKSIRSDK